MSRKYGNRYSGGLTLTDREAKTLSGFNNKLLKIMSKKNRFIGEVRKMNEVYSLIRQIVKDADREDVL